MVVAVPEKVISPVAELKLAEIPGGSPFTPGTPLLAIPVTPVVGRVNGLRVGLLIQTLGKAMEGGPTVANGSTSVTEEAVVEAIQPVEGSVNLTVTVLEPILSHWMVTDSLVVPIPPAVIV